MKKGNFIFFITSTRISLFGIPFILFWKAIKLYFSKEFIIDDLSKELRKVGYKGSIRYYNSGRSALQAVLQSISKTDQREVILPSFTCGVVISSVLNAGLIPLIVDIENNNYPNIGFEKIKEAIGNKTLAIILPYMAGYPINNLKKIVDYCRSKKIIIIDDIAQSFNLRYGKILAGNIGDFGIISFGSGKQLLSGGGGALISNIANNMKSLKPSKKKSKNIIIKYLYFSFFLRFNFFYFLDILLTSLNKNNKYNQVNENKILPINLFNASLATILLRNKHITLDKIQKNSLYYIEKFSNNTNISFSYKENAVYSKFYIQTTNQKQRNNLRKHLRNYGIETEQAFNSLDSRHQYSKYKYKNCKNSNEYSKTTLMIPNFFHLKTKDLDKVILKINRFYG